MRALTAAALAAVLQLVSKSFSADQSILMRPSSNAATASDDQRQAAAEMFKDAPSDIGGFGTVVKCMTDACRAMNDDAYGPMFDNATFAHLLSQTRMLDHDEAREESPHEWRNAAISLHECENRCRAAITCIAIAVRPSPQMYRIAHPDGSEEYLVDNNLDCIMLRSISDQRPTSEWDVFVDPTTPLDLLRQHLPDPVQSCSIMPPPDALSVTCTFDCTPTGPQSAITVRLTEDERGPLFLQNISEHDDGKCRGLGRM